LQLYDKTSNSLFFGRLPGKWGVFYDLPKSLIWRAGQTPELRGFSRSAILLRNQVFWLRHGGVCSGG